MKIGFAFAAVAVALDADYTDALTNNNQKLTEVTDHNKCFSCEATGANTAATLGACHTQGSARGLQTCDDKASDNPQVCFLSVVKNGSGEVTAIRTGCSEPNSCNAQSRQNFVGGIGFLSQCKADPTRWNSGRYRFTSTQCNTCLPLCKTDTGADKDCFDPNNAATPIYDPATDGYVAIPTTPDKWMTGYWINEANNAGR